MRSKVIYLFLLCVLGCKCNLYKAGNLVVLSYPIDTKLSYEIRKHYLDVMSNSGEFKVPKKWAYLDKLTDINPDDSWRIYFKEGPEEMYLITISANFILQDVYNPDIVVDDWVADRNRMPKKEKERVLRRAEEEILNRIERMAKSEGCADSILYFKPEYINGKWTDAPQWPPDSTIRKKTSLRTENKFQGLPIVFIRLPLTI